MGNSLREKEGAVLREITFIEHQQELATIWTKTLNGMGKTSRKQPQIALAHVIDKHRAVRIHDRDAGVAVEHDRPLISGVPVQFAKAAGSKPHIHAGQIF